MAKSELHMNLKYASKDVAIAEIKRINRGGDIESCDEAFYENNKYSYVDGFFDGYIRGLMQIFDISQKEIDLE